MMIKTLSIIVPVYNEERTVVRVLDALAALRISDWRFEIIVVDDGSRDDTGEKIASWVHEASERERGVHMVRHSDNRGKGAAIRSGLGYATGDAVLIQDADLEYDPADIPHLLNALGDGVDAVFGSRNLEPTGRGYWHFVVGVKALTMFTNILFHVHLTDIYTGYKLVRTEQLRACNLASSGFDIEAEITAKLLTRGARIAEVPIRYFPRAFREGKKIRARDGITGAWTIFRHKIRG